MGFSVKIQQAFIEVLAKSSKNQASALIETIDKQQMNAICEILLNLQFGNIPLSDTDKKKLQRKRAVIRKLTAKRSTSTLKKALLKKEIPLIIFVSKLTLPHIKSIV